MAFKFYLAKTKCLIVGKTSLQNEPKWLLGTDQIQKVEAMDVLGICFSANGKTNGHLDNRITATRRAMFVLCSSGMSYPGISTEVKVHLWDSIGVPCLMYGTDAIHLTECSIQKLESMQGSILQKCLGIGNRSHCSKKLKSLGISLSIWKFIKTLYLTCIVFLKSIPPIEDYIRFYFGKYVTEGTKILHTQIDRVVGLGDSPTFNKPLLGYSNTNDDGVVDSLRYLLHHENYIKPWSVEHNLV